MGEYVSLKDIQKEKRKKFLAGISRKVGAVAKTTGKGLGKIGAAAGSAAGKAIEAGKQYQAQAPARQQARIARLQAEEAMLKVTAKEQQLRQRVNNLRRKTSGGSGTGFESSAFFGPGPAAEPRRQGIKSKKKKKKSRSSGSGAPRSEPYDPFGGGSFW